MESLEATWIAQQGHALVTSSSKEDYDREDLDLDGIKLSDSEMRQLNTQRDSVSVPPVQPLRTTGEVQYLSDREILTTIDGTT